MNFDIRNELKKKFGGKTILKDINYATCTFVVTGFSFILVLPLMCQNKPLYIIDYL
jgi:hypothetical protein